MRVVIVAFVLVPIIAYAQSGSSVTFPSVEHHFGEMKQHERDTHEFIFYNSGGSPVRLTQPKASCGCTAALLSSYDVAPGDTGKISVTFTAVPGVTGEIAKNIYVNAATNPPQQLAVLTIKANVVGEITTDQTYIRYESIVGDTEEIRIHVTSNSESSITLDNVSVGLMEYADTTAGKAYNVNKVRASPVTDFKLTIDDKTLEKGESTYITVAVPSKEKGQINGSVRIALPNSTVSVGISGVISRE